MKLALVKHEDMGDWFTIERAEHDGKRWIETVEDEHGTYGRCMYSGRVADACVEGNAAEMLGMAEGIETRKGYSAKRCEVRIVGERALFCSPRNSAEGGEGESTLAEADELAAEIRRVLA